MILSSSIEDVHEHAIEPLVRNLIREHGVAESVLRAAWESVLIFLEESDRAIFSEPDAVALLYARALAGCNQPEAARCIAALVPSAAALSNHLHIEALSLDAIRSLAAGVLRPVANSSLSSGLVLVIDGSRFQRDSRFDVDLLLLPALRKLVNSALSLLDGAEVRGMLLFRGWTTSRDSQEIRTFRRDMVEAWLAQETPPARRPELIWVD